MATRIKPKRSETSSSVPTTSNLAVGEIAINSADQKIYTRDSNDNIVTLAQPGLLNVVEDTTPQLGGDLDTNGNNINFGDNDTAQFGDSNDLKIYHTGGSSYISDDGTGHLNLRTNGSDIRMIKTDGTIMLQAVPDDRVDLYYSGSKKFETTNAGATVTGNLTATGNLTVTSDSSSNGIFVKGRSSDDISTLKFLSNDGQTSQLEISSRPTTGIFNHSTDTSFRINNTEVFGLDSSTVKVNETGADVDFIVESVNNANMLHVNAGNDKVGIGGVPSEKLSVIGSNNTSAATLKVKDTDGRGILISSPYSGSGVGFIGTDGTNSAFGFKVNGTEYARFGTNGYLGIGTTAPGSDIHIKRTGSVSIFLQADSDNDDETHVPSIKMASDGNTSSAFNIGIEGVAGTEFTGSLANAPYIHAKNATSQPLQLANAGSVIMTLGDDKVGIGTTSPSTLLHLSSSDPQITITDTDGTGSQVIKAVTDDLTLDAVSSINLDADSGVITFKDGGTQFGSITKSGNDLRLVSSLSDGDLVFRGNDGGVGITALTLDMSEAGAATFNSNITVGGTLNTHTIPSGTGTLALTSDLGLSNVVEDTTPQLGGDLDLNSSNITGTGDINITGRVTLANSCRLTLGDAGEYMVGDGTNLTISSSGHTSLGSTGNLYLANTQTIFRDGSSTNMLRVDRGTNSVYLESMISDDDFIIKGNDGGVIIDALTFDMSESGNATFNNNVTVGNNLVVTGDLTVSGTTTTVNTETINLADNVIVLNSNATGSATENAGIEVERGDDTNKTLIWNETDDKWTVGSETFVAGTFEGNVTGNLDGIVGGTTPAAGSFTTGSFSGNLTLSSSLTAGGGTGTSGQFLQSTGTGVTWADSTACDWSPHATLKNIWVSDGTPAYTTGNYNVAIGYCTMTNNTSSCYSIAIGCCTAYCGTQGTCDIYIGQCSGFFQTPTGATSKNVAIGALTLRGTNLSSCATYNTAIGTCAGISVTTGCCNTMLGFASGYNLTTGNNNTVIGYGVTASSGTVSNETTIGGSCFRFPGLSTTTGNILCYNGTHWVSCANSGCDWSPGTIGSSYRNVYVSDTACSLTSGNCNTIVGTCAGCSLTTGTCNTLIGICAGRLLTDTSARQNVAIGQAALGQVQYGRANVAIGYLSLGGATAGGVCSKGEYNIGIGSYAGFCLNGSGCCNIMIGEFAGNNITSGKQNIAIGIYTLSCTTTTSNQVGVGSCALRYVSGINNTAIGASSLQGDSSNAGSNSGSNNVAVGISTMSNITTGNNNTVVGASSATISTGSNNVILGQLSGRHGSCRITGDCNIILGSCAGNSLANDNSGSNNIIIGHGADLTAGTDSNQIILGNSSHTTLVIPGLSPTSGQTLCFDGTGFVATDSTACDWSPDATLKNIWVSDGTPAFTTGNYNVSVGDCVMHNTTTSCYSIGIGHCTAYCGTTGSCDVYIGQCSGFFQTPTSATSKNVALGALTLRGSNGSSCAVYNTAIGTCAGISVTTGCCNTMLGFASGYNITTGNNNITIGYAVLPSSGTVSNETTIGGSCFRFPGLTSASSGDVLCYNGTHWVSGGGGCDWSPGTIGSIYCNVYVSDTACSLTQGSCNTIVGTCAGCSLTTGKCNVLVGLCSGRLLTASACNNVAIGTDALGRVEVACGNVALGTFAMGGATTSGVCSKGNENVAIGSSAGYCINSGGYYNVLIGHNAGTNHAAASGSVAIGHYALYSTTNNGGSVAIGCNSQRHIGGGTANTSIGGSSMIGCGTSPSTNTGSHNVALGTSQLSCITTGCYNTAIGGDIGSAVSTGCHNIFLGAGTAYHGTQYVTGSCNIIIGNCSGCALANDNSGNNNILIGHNVDLTGTLDGTCSNVIILGNSSHTTLIMPGLSASNGQTLCFDGTGFVAADRSGVTPWQAVCTSAFTAVAGLCYFIDTTSAAITATLPASASLGDEIHFKDYADTFDTNNLTIGRNSHNIEGSAADLTVATEGAGFTLVYVDSTKGWLLKDV